MSKFVKITHYVEDSYSNKPSFIIRLDDGKEYISNGCQFLELTDDNIKQLVREYDCSTQINELLSAPPIDTTDLVCGSGMFLGYDGITEWTHSLPKLVNGEGMFSDSKFTEWHTELPKLEDGDGMFCRSMFAKWDVELPMLVDGSDMFFNSMFTEWHIELPELVHGRDMFNNSMVAKWHIELPKLMHSVDKLSKSEFTY